MLRSALMSITLALGATQAQGDSLDNLAERLMELRSEIESRHDQLQQEKELHRSKIQSLGVVKSDLTATNQREQLRNKQTANQLEEAKLELSSKFSATTSDLKLLVKSSLANFTAYVETTLPFKKDQRLKGIADIKTQLADGSVSPYRAANMIWAFIEDEMRLQKDVAMYKQVLTVDGEEQLCDIAKLGMMTMFFKTPTGKYGLVKKSGDQWQAELVANGKNIQSIDRFFASLKKQIRVGVFTLPNFIEAQRI